MQPKYRTPTMRTKCPQSDSAGQCPKLQRLGAVKVTNTGISLPSGNNSFLAEVLLWVVRQVTARSGPLNDYRSDRVTVRSWPVGRARELSLKPSFAHGATIRLRSTAKESVMESYEHREP